MNKEKKWTSRQANLIKKAERNERIKKRNLVYRRVDMTPS